MPENIQSIVANFFEVAGTAINPETVSSALAQSFLRCVQQTDSVELDSVLSLGERHEALIILLQTGAPQYPVYDVYPVERLALIFTEDASPTVIPLRKGFPAAPHTVGLPIRAPIDADLSLCIDDRPWDDAQQDYNGPEILRRILAWFDRASSGRMNDDQQFTDPAFLPSPTTVILTRAATAHLKEEDGQTTPHFIALTSKDQDSKIWIAEVLGEETNPAGEGQEWVPHILIPIHFKVDNDKAMWRPPETLGHLRTVLRSIEFDFLDRVRDRINGLIKTADNETRTRLFSSRPMIIALIENVRSQRIETFGLLSGSSTGEIGVALGLLHAPDTDLETSYTCRLQTCEPDRAALDRINMLPVNLSPEFDRNLAVNLSNRKESDFSAAVFGAGSIGSQTVNNLVREGAFRSITIVDDDRLMPHNIARHTLNSKDVGSFKVDCVARDIKDIRPDLPVQTIRDKLTSRVRTH